MARAKRKEADRDEQRDLGLSGTEIAIVTPNVVSRAIEDPEFPFEVLSDTAEAESWRKEIHRPIYHVHKWWARRLGTVFRATVIGALAPKGSDVLKLFYQRTRFPGAVVFDPFMGSGTTIGEALKLGARAIGRDINPVAHFLVRNALQRHDRKQMDAAFRILKDKVAPSIRRFYKAFLDDGTEGEALYYFWVKVLGCPKCHTDVDLFSTRVFARNAYVKKKPKAHATCPACGEVNEVRYDSEGAQCRRCLHHFNPQRGPAEGQKAHCPACANVFPIAKTFKKSGSPPRHRLYAKYVLTPDGRKTYVSASDFDMSLFEEAERGLKNRESPYPVVALEKGLNTDQAINYGYRHWHEFFNARQLMCLAILSDGIRQIENVKTKELFVCLFSGVLEFNNMFASYKGEGTGAVRHMFAHHILKPERTPLEANLWGTPASSGAFSTLYESRIIRALDYADDPVELKVEQPGETAKKIGGLSEPMGYSIATNFENFDKGQERLYLSCGDSRQTDIPVGSVDAVITDPPFYDNVHYSQLADFFHVWQRHILGNAGTRDSNTTRTTGEVQDEDEGAFTDKLSAVLREAHRVLQPHGLLVFSYHHSRQEGWSSVLVALMRSEFRVVTAHPIKAEMSVAMPKSQANEPIDLDILMVCRKHDGASASAVGTENIWASVEEISKDQVRRLTGRRRKLSRNDVRVIVMAQALCRLTNEGNVEIALSKLSAWEKEADALIHQIHAEIAPLVEVP